MNKTSDILTKQYIKLCNERDLLTKECDDLPVGSIQQKKIKNGVYFYRQYREGTTVKTVFVPRDQLTEVSKSIKRRKEIEKRLKEINTEIAHRMIQIRKRRKISQKELAARSGVSLGSLKRFEQSGEISLQSFTKLAIALEVEKELESLFSEVPFSSIEEVIHGQNK